MDQLTESSILVTTQNPGDDVHHRPRLQERRVRRIDLNGSGLDTRAERLHESSSDDRSARDGRGSIRGEESLTAATDGGVTVRRVLTKQDVERRNGVQDRVLQVETLLATLNERLDDAKIDIGGLFDGDLERLTRGLRGRTSAGLGGRRSSASSRPVGDEDRKGVRLSAERKLGGRKDVLLAIVGPVCGSRVSGRNVAEPVRWRKQPTHESWYALRSWPFS